MIKLKNILNEGLARGLKPLLMIGSTIKKTTGENALLDLSDKFEDIDDEQADDIASHLNMAIELMQDGYSGDATKKLKQFNKACADALRGKPVKSAFENVNEAATTEQDYEARVEREARYKHDYKSITAMTKDYNRIFGPIFGHPRVGIMQYSEMEKTGRMKPSSIEISGDKIWVDAYKKIAFNGNGRKGDVIDFVRKQTGDSNV